MKPKLIQQLRDRDSHCYHCGVTNDLVPHHRRNRAMGGSKLLDKLSNLILVCSAYNGAMESDATIASQARDYGHKLGQWDNFDTPVFDKVSRRWFMITDNGDKIETTPPQFLI
jgi:hypothetical protein